MDPNKRDKAFEDFRALMKHLPEEAVRTAELMRNLEAWDAAMSQFSDEERAWLEFQMALDLAKEYDEQTGDFAFLKKQERVTATDSHDRTSV